MNDWQTTHNILFGLVTREVVAAASGIVVSERWRLFGFAVILINKVR